MNVRTFRIGGVHPEENKLSHDAVTQVAALPKQAIFPLSQHIGAPAKPVVQKGDKVKVGTMIAEAGGFVSAPIFSSVSGTVFKIDTAIDAMYRLTGVITSVANTNYGNVYIRDWSGETYVYGIGAKGDFTTLGLKVGDVVTLVGKRGAHNGNPQMTGGQHESHISVTEVTIAEFLTKPDDKNVYYMVTGTLDEIANATYGNVYIKDAEGNRLYSYGCYPGWGATGDARKNAIANLDIHVGDQLTIIGAKTTHNDQPQINNGVYFSHVPAN